jgi:hypothetical protein
VAIETALSAVAAVTLLVALVAHGGGGRCAGSSPGGDVLFGVSLYAALTAIVLGLVLLVAAGLRVARGAGALGAGSSAWVASSCVVVAVLVFAVWTTECFAPGGLGF